jgi:hypothetical protein
VLKRYLKVCPRHVGVTSLGEPRSAMLMLTTTGHRPRFRTIQVWPQDAFARGGGVRRYRMALANLWPITR